MRTQENKEKYKEYDHKYYIKNKRPKTKIGQLESEINQLKQQLEDEKKLHSLAKAFYDEKQAEFDKLLYDYNKLKQQLKEKDKEIEELKQEINEWIGHKFVELKYQKAIQELEKVLTSVDVPNLSGNSQKSISLSRLRKVIQQQIKELKEKE